MDLYLKNKDCMKWPSWYIITRQTLCKNFRNNRQPVYPSENCDKNHPIKNNSHSTQAASRHGDKLKHIPHLSQYSELVHKIHRPTLQSKIVMRLTDVNDIDDDGGTGVVTSLLWMRCRKVLRSCMLFSNKTLHYSG